MSEKHWWRVYGHFEPWEMCPTRPDPGEVLLFSLDRRGIRPEQHIDYFMKLLDLQKTKVYDILKGEGLDSISRCRQLVQALSIHPPLLGIDAKYHPIEHHAYWWRACGFFFHADAQGYPDVCEVIAGLRIQRTKTEEGGRVKVWSQEDLADATGLTKDTIYNMEHDKTPQILDSMSRRTMLASALGTLAGEKESTLFRLFGLDPQAYGISDSAHETILFLPGTHSPKKAFPHEMLKGHQRRQAAFYTDFYTRHAQSTVGKAFAGINQLQTTVMPLANTTTQYVSILALQSRYQMLLLAVARDKCKKQSSIFHASRVLKLAEQAMAQPNPKLSSDRALLVTTNELLAAALLTSALAYYGLDEYELAQEYIDRALNLLPTLQSSQLKPELLTTAGLIHAYTVKTPMDQRIVLSYFNQAAQLTNPSQFQPDIPDDNFFRCGNDLLYIRKATALSAPRMKGATEETVDEILQQARRLTNPELMRRQTLIDVFQALAHFIAGEYQEVTEVALDALEKSRQIRSHQNRDRLEKLYKELLQTSFRDKPRLAYLGMKLRTWDHGVG